MNLFGGKTEPQFDQASFSIYDSKAQLFFFPWPEITEGTAIRKFTELANNPEGSIGKNPEDYILFKVGAWNQSKGCFVNLDKPQSLGVASGYVRVGQ